MSDSLAEPQRSPDHPVWSGGAGDPGGGLSCAGVSVAFGATRALAGVDLRVRPGEIVGLMGHNGAGKSTLLNVAAGALRPDAGTVRVGSTQATHFGDPRHFAELGVTVIHQEPALAPNLSIVDNLMLGRPRRFGRRETAERCAQVLSDLGLTRDPATPVAMLSLGERQMVDLARGLLGGRIEVLLLDEPAAALGADETRFLHDRVRRLAAQGTAVVYVSHRLPDVLDICQRIVVLREGRVMLDDPRSAYDAGSLARALADGATADLVATAGEPGAERCTVQRGDEVLRFRAGEVVGLFGVAAGPQFELLDALFRGTGELRATLEGRSFSSQGPAHAIARGIHLVPGDRERDGLVPTMSALDNVFLPWNGQCRRHGRVASGAQRRRYQQIRTELNIRGPDGSAAIGSFSGGNRQKHLLARWISVRAPRLLLLAQPTQGVDQAAKADIRSAVRALAADGVAVVVASAESDELSTLCDRVYALTTRETVALETGPELDERLLTLISGDYPIDEV